MGSPSSYKNVTAGSDQGLGSTTCDVSDGMSSFAHRALPELHGGYLSLDTRTASAGGDELYSMAPRDGASTSMGLIAWAATGGPPRIIAPLGDGHQPSLFGDVAATMSGVT